VRASRRGEQRREQSRIVEQRVDALVAKHLLAPLHLARFAARDQSHRELRVISRESVSNVGENHAFSS